jgi:ABC-type transport system involved in multi-copper enzyme maturation permease subunit
VTLYARGYRPYERDESRGGGFPAGRVRFLTILAEGYRDARRSRAYRVLGVVIACITTVHGFLLYFRSGILMRALVVPRNRPSHGPARPDVGGMGTSPSEWLEGTLAHFHDASWFFVVLLALFVGSGLIADDLRSRALPLYLSRPLHPFDYYLGKLLIPVRSMAMLFLLPMLVLVALGVLMQPSEEMLGFAADQGGLVGAILVYFVATSLAYGSLILLFSAWTSRRLTSLVLGAVVLLGGEIVRNAVRRLHGDVADLLRATSLMADTKVVLFGMLGRDASLADYADHPPMSAALLAIFVVVVLGAAAVLRRARSVEVTG